MPTAVHPRAQDLGLKLRDIKDLLAIRDTGVCSGEPAEELLRRRLADLDAEIGSAERAARADGGPGRGAAISALRTAGARQLVRTREPQAVIPVIEAPCRANCDPRMYRPQLPCGC